MPLMVRLHTEGIHAHDKRSADVFPLSEGHVSVFFQALECDLETNSQRFRFILVRGNEVGVPQFFHLVSDHRSVMNL